MFQFRTTHGNGHHYARWNVPIKYPSWVSHLTSNFYFCFFCLYFPRISPCFWSLLQLWSLGSAAIYRTVSCCGIWHDHHLPPSHRSAIPSRGPRDGATITSNPWAIQFEHWALCTLRRHNAAVLECDKRDQRTKGMPHCVYFLFKLNIWPARLYILALLVYNCDNCRRRESKNGTVSQATPWIFRVLIVVLTSSVIGFRCMQGIGWTNMRSRYYAWLIISFPKIGLALWFQSEQQLLLISLNLQYVVGK